MTTCCLCVISDFFTHNHPRTAPHRAHLAQYKSRLRICLRRAVCVLTLRKCVTPSVCNCVKPGPPDLRGGNGRAPCVLTSLPFSPARTPETCGGMAWYCALGWRTLCELLCQTWLNIVCSGISVDMEHSHTHSCAPKSSTHTHTQRQFGYVGCFGPDPTRLFIRPVWFCVCVAALVLCGCMRAWSFATQRPPLTWTKRSRFE